MKTYLQKHDKIKYSDHWATPKEIYNNYIIDLGYIDPCPLGSYDFDFRMINNNIFLNPPYSNIAKWVDWAINNHINNNFTHIVILIPSRTDTKYFHNYLK